MFGLHFIAAMEVRKGPRILDVVITTGESRMKYFPYANGRVPILLEVLRDGCGISERAPVLIWCYPPHMIGVWPPASEQGSSGWRAYSDLAISSLIEWDARESIVGVLIILSAP